MPVVRHTVKGVHCRAIAFSKTVAIDTLLDSWVLIRPKLSQSLTEFEWTQMSGSIGHCSENAIALASIGTFEPGILNDGVITGQG